MYTKTFLNRNITVSHYYSTTKKIIFLRVYLQWKFTLKNNQPFLFLYRQSLKHLSVSAPAIKSAGVIMGTSSSDNEYIFAPTSSKSRQKKFHRHFSNVSQEEKVLDCKWMNSLFLWIMKVMRLLQKSFQWAKWVLEIFRISRVRMGPVHPDSALIGLFLFLRLIREKLSS